MSETRIACVQMDVKIGEVEENCRRIRERIAQAAEGGARLAIFPECALTGYAFESLAEASAFAEPIDGPSSEAFAETCRETGLYAVIGFIEKAASGFFNAAMLVGPNGVIGSYRKVHLPFLGVDRFLTPGDRPFEVFELPFGKIGILICYDISFPEAARALKLGGAELIALPTNWPPGARRTPDFIVQTRANENHIFFAAVDRIGTERGWPFIGRSTIADCNGDLLAQGSEDGEEILYADIDPQSANNNRIVNVAGSYEVDRINDRRPEFYTAITAASRQMFDVGC